MFSLNRTCLLASTSRRLLSTKAKLSVQLDESTAVDLQQNAYKHRKHPGMDRTVGPVALPATVVDAIGKALGEYPPKKVWSEALTLTRYLRARHAPVEPEELADRRQRYARDLLDEAERTGLPTPDDKQLARHVQRLMNQRTYSWKPIGYDAYRSLQYLLGRAPPEYAVLMRIFGEIAQRRPQFAVRSFFDFGSGVGTGTWVASHWWRKSIFEYYLVDAARDMNDLADLLLRNGNENGDLQLKNVNFRQFLPSSPEPKYDLVLSAFSLLELPDARSRLETLQTLWAKCDGFLVLVEQGTRSGFSVINEARDFLLHTSRKDGSCRTFAPCAHNLGCPRQLDTSDRTPCNFLAAYTQLPYAGSSEVRYEPYSYVVLEKRPADGTQSDANADDSWPRIVRPTLVRSRHTICRMCTAGGRLEEVIFTQSRHGKDAYRCARSSRWGDRLPVWLEPSTETTTEVIAEKND